MTTTEELIRRRCEPCEGGVPPLAGDTAEELLRALDSAWSIVDDGKSIVRLFEFAAQHNSARFKSNQSGANHALWQADRDRQLYNRDRAADCENCARSASAQPARRDPSGSETVQHHD